MEKLSKVRQPSGASRVSNSSHTNALWPWLKVIPGTWLLAPIVTRSRARAPADPEKRLVGRSLQLDMQEERLSLRRKLNMAFDKKHNKTKAAH